MHQTTVRFGTDLWQRLEREAERAGVSAAQYVRDATLARLAYTAGERGEPFFAGGATRSTAAGAAARAVTEESTAVWAQARLARERARSVRAGARAVQGRTHE